MLRMSTAGASSYAKATEDETNPLVSPIRRGGTEASRLIAPAVRDKYSGGYEPAAVRSEVGDDVALSMIMTLLWAMACWSVLWC